MSLATRCTACGTIFRVVQDQLRVSEGWVRCGRCAEVFDAREQLFDIDREAPPSWPAEMPAQAYEAQDHQSDIVSAPEPPTWHQASDATDAFVDAAPPAPASRPLVQDPMAAEPTPGTLAPRESHEPRFNSPIDSQFDSRLNSRLEPHWVDEDEPAVAPSSDLAAPEPAELNETPATAIDAGPDAVLAPGLAGINETRGAAVEPSFMRRTNNAQRWHQPGVRFALGSTAVLLLALLGMQVTYQFHDAIAALYPPARASLQALCQASGCELRPWQRIDAVSVENSALSQAGAGNQYQLAVTLHNKSGLEVATPWIELNLTDTAGVLVMRRVLAPTDFKTGKPSLAAGADLPLQLALTTGQQKVSGYSVEIFHP